MYFKHILVKFVTRDKIKLIGKDNLRNRYLIFHTLRKKGPKAVTGAVPLLYLKGAYLYLNGT